MDKKHKNNQQWPECPICEGYGRIPSVEIEKRSPYSRVINSFRHSIEKSVNALTIEVPSNNLSSIFEFRNSIAKATDVLLEEFKRVCEYAEDCRAAELEYREKLDDLKVRVIL